MRIREIQINEMRKDRDMLRGGGGTHPYDEMLSILHGSAALQWMGKVYEAEAPALFLLPANTPHTLYPKSNRIRFGYIELDAEQDLQFPNISQAHAWNVLQSSPPPDPSPLWPMLRRTETSLWESYQELRALKEPSPLMPALLLLDVRKLLLLIEQLLQDQAGGTPLAAAAGRKRKPSDVRQRLQHMIRFIESNYQQPLSVAELARQAGMETNHFIRCFKQTASTTPLQYLHELRLNAACSLLMSTSLPVQAIAAEVGFQNLHYFSRLFKQRYTVSPSVWRHRRRESRGPW